MTYITDDNLQGYLKRDLTDEESSLFDIIEAYAKRVIDQYCDTVFEEVDESSRFFDGGEQDMDIDPCTAISAIASVDTSDVVISTYEDNTFVTEPRNKTVKNSVRSRFGRFPRGMKNIKITAKFSSFDTEVPENVKVASMKICADVFNNPNGFTKESIEGYSYQLGKGVMTEINKILAPYRQVLL